jgi:hypothetical protein
VDLSGPNCRVVLVLVAACLDLILPFILHSVFSDTLNHSGLWLATTQQHFSKVFTVHGRFEPDQCGEAF